MKLLPRRAFLALLTAAWLVLGGDAEAAYQPLCAPGQTSTLTAWTTSNGTLNATQSISSSLCWLAALVQLDQTTTITAGAISFQGTYDGTNWVTVNTAQVADPTSASLAKITLPYTLQASTNKSFLVLPGGFQQLRIIVTTAITGTGSVTPYVTLIPSYIPTPVQVAADSTIIAGANPGRTYNAIAASQTTQALTGGSGGAIGDYLGFCVVTPTSTSPGVVTIFDNSTQISSFPGGASSLSNLVPFTIPVGAVSVNGAWKITTGAGVAVVCTGKFT